MCTQMCMLVHQRNTRTHVCEYTRGRVLVHERTCGSTREESWCVCVLSTPEEDEPGRKTGKTVVRERVCCLLVHNSVTSTPQWIRQPWAAWLCVWCLCVLCLCASKCSDILGSLSLGTSGYTSSGTLAFSLRRMPPRPAADAALTHTGSSAALPTALLPFYGPISFTFLPRPDLHYIHLQ
jgi:hypothetical protein